MKYVLSLIALLACVLAHGQRRYQLGNPSLIIDLPGKPTSGGVAWHDSPLSVFPTSLSAESEDLRVEVAESYSNQNPSDIATAVGQKLGGTAQILQTGATSGYPGVLFKVGERQGMAIAAEGRGWIVLASPKTPIGGSAVADILASVVVERSGNQRWVRRSLGRTNLNAMLPFELAAEAPRRIKTVLEAYELHFDDFRVTASVSAAEEGKQINFDGTVKGYIEGEKNVPGTSDFTSKRERIKDPTFEGDLVSLQLKRGTRAYHVKVLFIPREGKLLRLEMTGHGDKPQHEGYAEKIYSSLKLASVDFANFVPRQVGSEGIWFDAPAEFEGPREVAGSQTYGLPFPAVGVDVRITANPSGASNPDQLMEFIEAKLKPQSNARDYRSDVSKRLVDGLEARVLRIRYKEPGRKDDTLRTGMAIFLPDRIAVVEAIANEQQGEYLERLIDTARVELRAPEGWRRYPLAESGLSVLFGTKPELEQVKPEDAGVVSTTMVAMQDSGIFGQAMEQKYESAAPLPGMLVPKHLEGLRKALNMPVRISDQRPIEVGAWTGIRAGLEIDGGNLLGDMIILRRGQILFTYVIGLNPSAPEVALKRAIMINSLR